MKSDALVESLQQRFDAVMADFVRELTIARDRLVTDDPLKAFVDRPHHRPPPPPRPHPDTDPGKGPAVRHFLKCWPVFFEAVFDGRKRFELRFDDREFQVGDTVVLQEYNPTTEIFTGRQAWRRILYIYSGSPLPFGYVCLSLADWEKDQ